MVKERERLRRLTEKMVDLRDEVITQKAKIKALRNKRKENTPATGIMADLNTVITKKKKSLDHLKRLNNGKNPSYEFWQRAIHHKITINKHKTPTAAKQVDYIINRCEGKAAAYLKADLRKRIFNSDLERLINFLKDLFNNPHRQDKAL